MVKFLPKTWGTTVCDDMCEHFSSGKDACLPQVLMAHVMGLCVAACSDEAVELVERPLV